MVLRLEPVVVKLAPRDEDREARAGLERGRDPHALGLIARLRDAAVDDDLAVLVRAIGQPANDLRPGDRVGLRLVAHEHELRAVLAPALGPLADRPGLLELPALQVPELEVRLGPDRERDAALFRN
jgi:hypothetical protein